MNPKLLDIMLGVTLGAAFLWGQPPLLAQATPPADAKQNQSEAPKAEAENKENAGGAATYVTSVVCQGCHEDIFKAFQKNVHNVLETNKRRGWEEKACESCHGPGSKHAESVSPEDIKNPAKLKPSAADRTCLTCHVNQPTNAGRVHSGHARSQVACVTCHSVHKPQPKRAEMRTGQCIGCHTSTWAEFQRPFRHKIQEGAMSCADCHNPHGSVARSAWSNASMKEPGCYACHNDKRGPFTFEHAPVRLEGCSACHQPHGSVNPRMLTRHEVRFQCLECHSNVGFNSNAKQSTELGGVPPAFHDLRNPRYRNCTVCHIKIHGSHVDRAFTR
jgi:DmsE family decaheme c-type cytochrome